jgi:glycosyltransferase involved in cell wall biosynthesis
MKNKLDAVLIIPFLNESLYIKKFLSSLKNQEKIANKKYLTLFIDNGSLDNSSLIIKNFCDKENIPFKIINEPKKGTVYSRIKGLELAISLNPTIIISTDADVVLPKNFIYKTITDIKNQEADVLTGKLTKNKKINFLNKIKSINIYNLKQSIWNLEYSLFGPYFFGAYFAIKTSFAKNIQIYEAKIHEPFLGEDIYLSRRSHYLGAKFAKSSTFVNPNPRRLIASSINDDYKFIGNLTSTHMKIYKTKDYVFSPLNESKEKEVIKKLKLDAGKRLIWLTVDAYLFWEKNTNKYLNAQKSFQKSCIFFNIYPTEFDSIKNKDDQFALYNHIYNTYKTKVLKKMDIALNQNS